MSEFDYDLFVIGAGSGGVRASRIAASHGARVAVAEEHRIGGTCVIRGCVPKKLLVYGSMFAEELTHAEGFGWTIGEKSFSWKKLRDFVNGDVDRLEKLYTETLEGHGIEIFPQRATVTGPNSVELANGKEVTAQHILIATGAWPMRPDFEGARNCITSNEVFYLDTLPRCIVIQGGGYIAMEFAHIFNSLGSEVIVVNRTDRVLRGYDDQIVERMLKTALGRGIDFNMHAEIEKVENTDNGCFRVDVGSHNMLEADQVLIATGRAPNTSGLGLENVGIELDASGAIPVDDYSQTSCESVYAVGDVTNRVQLTPVAIREGHAFADSVFGKERRTVDYGCIPSAVFTQPPLASVGLTEQQARKKFASIRVYSSDFRPMKNMFSEHPERGLFKMVVDEDSGRVLGVHMIGPEAPEMLQIAAVAVKAGLTKQAFDDTVALHPSMAEELVLLK